MSYIAVTDLRRTKMLSQRLEEDGELVITRDGKPIAIMVGVDQDDIELSLREIRRARFSAAVARIRERAADDAVVEDDIAAAVSAVRRSRSS